MTRTAQIAALYHAGKGQREIGRLMGLSQPAVRKHLLKEGLLAPRHPSAEQLAAEIPDNHKNVIEQERAQKQDHNVSTTRNTPLSALPRGMVRCGICEGIFPSPYLGQRYCCNACGARVGGNKPVVDHSADCLRLVDNH